jgi:DNA ligase-1
VELVLLVEVWSELRKTRSRLRKVSLIAELLQQAGADEGALVVRYLSGQLPQGKIGVGYAALQKATAGALGLGGDGVSLRELDRVFDSIADESGPGSGGRRQASLRGLFERVTEDERRFLAGLIVGELRQGASEGLMLEAIAEAASVPADLVRRAFMLSGDLGRVAEVAFSGGAAALDELRIELFVPLRPMLAQPADDVQAAIDAHGELLFETKLDGARVQAHKVNGRVRVFSRALNEVTHAVPEVVEAVASLPCESVILDGEAIALRSDGRPHPFQVTMRRFGRRRDVDAERQRLPLSVYFFDVLYLDGESLIDAPLSARRERLASLVLPSNLPASVVTDDLDTAETLWSDTIGRGHEGLMAKSLGSAYEAGNRGSNWLKLKPTHTLDLVIVAAEWGSGRRRGWLSNLHLAAYDPESDDFVMLGKTFKGLTDELLEWQTKELLARETRRDDYTVYVHPELVAEIAFNDVQASPRYACGLALRFARMKGYRSDKAPTAADTLATVVEIHQKGGGGAVGT